MEFSLRKDIALAMDCLGLTEEQLCQRIGMSRSGLALVLKGELKSPAVMEAFYAFAYDAGLRINRSNEEVMRELYADGLLFHGSREGLGEITCRGSRPDCDFGAGFYLGESYDQAASFVCDAPKGSVYAFFLADPPLSVATFACDLEWMLAVCYFRGRLRGHADHPSLRPIIDKVEGADVIKAPIADNRMFQVMRQFGEGDITTAEALHALSASSLGEQTVLKTEKAVRALIPLAHLYLSVPERRRFLASGEERAKEIDTKLKMAKREFRNEGKYIDELFQ